MDQFEKDQFWAGLNRLYLESVALKESITELRHLSESHEKRLDKIEVVQQWLAEKERKREKGEA